MAFWLWMHPRCASTAAAPIATSTAIAARHPMLPAF